MTLFVKSALAMSLVLALPPLSAQGARDPTLPPLDSGLASQAVPKNSASASEGSLSVIVRDGVFFLVQGTRLLAQGQKLGEARIERISETEVWLRQRGVLTKRPIFAGIARRAVASEASRVGAPLLHSSP